MRAAENLARRTADPDLRAQENLDAVAHLLRSEGFSPSPVLPAGVGRPLSPLAASPQRPAVGRGGGTGVQSASLPSAGGSGGATVAFAPPAPAPSPAGGTTTTLEEDLALSSSADTSMEEDDAGVGLLRMRPTGTGTPTRDRDWIQRVDADTREGVLDQFERAVLQGSFYHPGPTSLTTAPSPTRQESAGPRPAVVAAHAPQSAAGGVGGGTGPGGRIAPRRAVLTTPPPDDCISTLDAPYRSEYDAHYVSRLRASGRPYYPFQRAAELCPPAPRWPPPALWDLSQEKYDESEEDYSTDEEEGDFRSQRENNDVEIVNLQLDHPHRLDLDTLLMQHGIWNQPYDLRFQPDHPKYDRQAVGGRLLTAVERTYLQKCWARDLTVAFRVLQMSTNDIDYRTVHPYHGRQLYSRELGALLNVAQRYYHELGVVDFPMVDWVERPQDFRLKRGGVNLLFPRPDLFPAVFTASPQSPDLDDIACETMRLLLLTAPTEAACARVPDARWPAILRCPSDAGTGLTPSLAAKERCAFLYTAIKYDVDWTKSDPHEHPRLRPVTHTARQTRRRLMPSDSDPSTSCDLWNYEACGITLRGRGILRRVRTYPPSPCLPSVDRDDPQWEALDDPVDDPSLEADSRAQAGRVGSVQPALMHALEALTSGDLFHSRPKGRARFQEWAVHTLNRFGKPYDPDVPWALGHLLDTLTQRVVEPAAQAVEDDARLPPDQQKYHGDLSLDVLREHWTRNPYLTTPWVPPPKETMMIPAVKRGGPRSLRLPDLADFDFCQSCQRPGNAHECPPLGSPW